MTDVHLVISRILFLAEKRGVSVNHALLESKVNKSMLDNMKRGSMPSADKLAAIADYFDCSVDYLLGRVDVPNPCRQKFRTACEVHKSDGKSRKPKKIRDLTPDEILQVRELLQKQE